MKFLFRSLSHSGCWQSTSLLEAWPLPSSHHPLTHTLTQKEKKARPQVLSITQALIRVDSNAPFCTLLNLSSFFNPHPHSFHSLSPAPTLSFSLIPPSLPEPFFTFVALLFLAGSEAPLQTFSSLCLEPPSIPLFSRCSPTPSHPPV